MLSPRAVLKAGAKAVLRRARRVELLFQAKAELLRELKSDPEILRTARSQATAEIKSRRAVAAEARKRALFELVLKDMSERERALLDDAFGFTQMYDFTEEDLTANHRLLDEFASLPEFRPESINWFVPHFDHVLRGGIRTIMMFADYFRREKGVRSRVIVHGAKMAAASYHEEIVKSFPDFAREDVVVSTDDDSHPDLPPSDVAIATLWTSAFHVLKFRRTRAKFYLVQDFEPLFYPAGTVYGLIEATYRFGFRGIANTPGVADAYRAVSKTPTQAFIPAVDPLLYYPLDPGQPKGRPGEPSWVVFYGRPDKRRNCFELGVLALARVKRDLGDRVRLISVGSDWDPDAFGVGGAIENWGLLSSLEEVANLYRRSSAGLCFMQTPHPSYQPFEYMACGCPTVTNRNPAHRWLLRDGENCILTESTVSSVAQAVVRVVTDEALRRRIIAAGLETVKHNSWERQIELVFDFICKKTPSAREA